jgi:hypothetical protein
MTAKRQLGAILLESGRISQDDVDKVLDYQRTHGGFFGQAIVALGILSREEIDWALASQFDLPFIFPNPDAVDREAAMLVPADWALAHLAVPIVKAGRSLTVVVADPLDADSLEDLHARTGYEVEMALASASRIRELIRSIYGDGSPVKPADNTPVGLNDLVGDALAAGADRIGISVRGSSATGWFAARNARERRPLTEGWETAFEDMLDPSPFEAAERSKGTMQKFAANLHRAGTDTGVDVQVMSGTGGTEYLMRPTKSAAAKRAAGISLPPAVTAELRLLARTGSARIAMPANGSDFVRDIVPQMPSLMSGESVRAAHITMSDDVPGVYTLRASEAGDDLVSAVDAYDFDAITVDMPLSDARAPSVIGVAPITFVYMDDTSDRDAMQNAGINWLLHVTRNQDALAWELRPVNR